MRDMRTVGAACGSALVVCAALLGCSGSVESDDPSGDAGGAEQDGATGGSGGDASAPDEGILPDTGGPDTPYPDGPFPDTAYPDTAYPDTAYPDTAYPDTAYPDTAYPDTDYPDSPLDACGLELVTTGTFPKALPTNEVQGPHVVATNTGFLVGYRTYGTDDRATFAFMDDHGGNGSTQHLLIASPACPTWNGDGMALAWNADYGNTGFAAISSSPCTSSDKPQMHVATLASAGLLTTQIVYELPSRLRLAERHGASVFGSSERFSLAGMTDGGPFLYEFDGVAVSQTVTPIVAPAGATYAMVSSTPSLLATLSAGTSPGVSLATDTSSMLLVSTDSNVLATSSGLTTWSVRALAAFPLATGFGYWLDDASAQLHIAGAIDGSAFSALDVAQLRHDVFVAGAAPGAIWVHRLAGADSLSASLSLVLTRLLAAPSVSELGGYDGKTLSMAAARDRVLVAWVADGAVSYALLRCQI